LTGNAGQAAYAASKAAIVGMAKSLAREFAPKDILVNVVAPGLIDTGADGMAQGIPADRLGAILDRVALGRAGRPEDVAAAVAYLAGPGGDYVTGQTLVVDGGLTM
jgi:3-oxoacyl-[acyl-carrier protein] reductase